MVHNCKGTLFFLYWPDTFCTWKLDAKHLLFAKENPLTLMIENLQEIYGIERERDLDRLGSFFLFWGGGGGGGHVVIQAFLFTVGVLKFMYKMYSAVHDTDHYIWCDLYHCFLLFLYFLLICALLLIHQFSFLLYYHFFFGGGGGVLSWFVCAALPCLLFMRIRNRVLGKERKWVDTQEVHVQFVHT